MVTSFRLCLAYLLPDDTYPGLQVPSHVKTWNLCCEWSLFLSRPTQSNPQKVISLKGECLSHCPLLSGIGIQTHTYCLSPQALGYYYFFFCIQHWSYRQPQRRHCSPKDLGRLAAKLYQLTSTSTIPLWCHFPPSLVECGTAFVIH